MVKHSLIFLPLDPCANPGKHIWVNEKAGAQEEDRVPKASPVDAHMIVRTSSPAFTGGETEAQAHTWICYGQAPSRVFLWPAGTLRRVPQMHPHFLRRCTLNSPGSTRPPSGPPRLASCHKCHSQSGLQLPRGPDGLPSFTSLAHRAARGARRGSHRSDRASVTVPAATAVHCVLETRP